MNGLIRQGENACNGAKAITGLDAQLSELIEFVWACEAAARREDHIDAVIRYGNDWGSK